MESNTNQAISNKLPQEFKTIMDQLLKLLKEHLPSGYEISETENAISVFIPHSLYSMGYHADPKKPLPYMQILVQKKHVALYHMGMYSNPQLLEKYKLEVLNSGYDKANTGKSCIRFKSTSLPQKALIQLIQSYSVAEWIKQYEASINL